MRTSLWLSATLKETPADAEIVSHQLMLRAGMIRKLGSGLYSWLPLGVRVLRKVENIVREEMNKAQALEVLMPAIQPAELWEETGRWHTFGGQLLTMKDSYDREYCFGPTHEEVITDLMRRELQSYKQLPVNLYQIQTKFRDEIRPRFGVMRAREFIMKDAYSFHANQESLQQTYDVMYQTYSRIFERLGLQYRAVEADTGAIGGAVSHEFQILADAGEDTIFYSNQSSYAANVEQAISLFPAPATTAPTDPKTLVDTPGAKSMEEVSALLNTPTSHMLKTLIVKGKNHPMIALVLRGDDTLNEVKAGKHPLVESPVQLIDEAAILYNLKAPIGSIGPIDLSIPVIADHEALALSAFVCGANIPDKHYINASWKNDAQYGEAWDLRNVKEGDKSPDGKGTLHACKGIEAGHIFQLGDKYSKSMHATVVNEQGVSIPMLMGCYGLGISRVVAAAIEQHHDEKGIIWPDAIAPFQLVIIPVNAHKSPKVQALAESLYQQLINQGYDVLLEDRQERPGVLFANHDLTGIPHRIIIGERSLEQNMVEYKPRRSPDSQLVSVLEIMPFLISVLKNS